MALASQSPRGCMATVGNVTRPGEIVRSVYRLTPHEVRSPVPIACLFVLASRLLRKGCRFSCSFTLRGGWQWIGDLIQLWQRCWYVASDGWLE